MRKNNKVIQESATGDGPVDAVFNSIDRAINRKFKVESYQVRSVTAGREAMGEAIIRIRNAGKIYTGRGVSTDVIEASAKAYLQAINMMESEKMTQKRRKQIKSEV
jgi:2-isopropylmalate synthase